MCEIERLWEKQAKNTVGYLGGQTAARAVLPAEAPAASDEKLTAFQWHHRRLAELSAQYHRAQTEPEREKISAEILEEETGPKRALST